MIRAVTIVNAICIWFELDATKGGKQSWMKIKFRWDLK